MYNYANDIRKARGQMLENGNYITKKEMQERLKRDQKQAKELRERRDEKIREKMLDMQKSMSDNLLKQREDIKRIKKVINNKMKRTEKELKRLIINDLKEVMIRYNLFDMQDMKLDVDRRTIEVKNSYINQSINVACDSPQAMVKDLLKGLKYA